MATTTRNQLHGRIGLLRAIVRFANGEGEGYPLTILYSARELVHESVIERLLTFGPAERKALEREVRAFLNGVLSGDETATRLTMSFFPFKHPPSPSTTKYRGVRTALQARALVDRYKNKQPVVSLVVNGSPRDVLLYQVASLLREVGIGRLGVCADPECGRPFVRITKKRFCSQRCQSRIYMRQLRADERSATPTTQRKKGSRSGKTARTR
jgi:hypothetical protein